MNNSWIEQWWDFVDNRGVIRRIVLGIGIWMTWAVSQWAMEYAISSTRPGLDIAAIIAAVTGPVTVFGGFVFKAYVVSRQPEIN